jgi:hypothetical protein
VIITIYNGSWVFPAAVAGCLFLGLAIASEIARDFYPNISIENRIYRRVIPK